jgi:hypothetical protein
MRTLTTIIFSAILITTAASFTACQTSQPGVKSSYRSQWTTIDATTTKATEMAKDVLADLKLKNVQANSTAVDGNVEGFTADNTEVSVEVERVTNKTSQVSVYVGAMGDPDLGKDILARIQEKAD